MAAGVIYGVAMRNSRRGRMAVLTLDDGSARVEVVVFGELFHEKRAVIQEDQVVVVQGRVSQDDFSGGIRFTADKLMDLAEIRSHYARAIRLSINGQADCARLRALLAPYAGGKCAGGHPLSQCAGRVRHPPAGRVPGEGVRAAARLALRVAQRAKRRGGVLAAVGERAGHQAVGCCSKPSKRPSSIDDDDRLHARRARAAVRPGDDGLDGRGRVPQPRLPRCRRAGSSPSRRGPGAALPGAWSSGSPRPGRGRGCEGGGRRAHSSPPTRPRPALGDAAQLLFADAPLARGARGLGRHALLRDVVEAHEPARSGARRRSRGCGAARGSPARSPPRPKAGA